MKKYIYLLAAALYAMTGCSDETITYVNPEPGPEPSGVIAELSISSKNTWFSADEDGNAAIGFKSTGGEVIVDIATNVAWECTTVNADWLTIEKDSKSDQIVLSCPSNKVEEAQQATVKITAGDKEATIAVSQNAYGTLEISASENNFTIAACGELTASFTVTSSDEDWAFQTQACPWLLVEKDGSNVTLTLNRNETFEDRETTFTLVAGEGSGRPVTETVRVIQDRAVYLTPSLRTVPFSATPVKGKEIVVDSNFEWEYSVSGDSEWITVERSESGLNVSPKNNSQETSRTAAITLKAGDGKANVTEQVITVSQSGFDFDAFIIGLNVASKDLRARLPFDKAVKVTIDWGDGTIDENVTDPYPTHTYTDADYYVVSVKGSVPSINSSNVNLTSYNQTDQINEIINWGRTGLTSMSNAFRGCDKLERICTDQTEAFANVTTFYYAFYGCTSMEAVPAGLFDSARIATDFGYVFYNCKLVTRLPEGLFKNCAKLSIMNSAFYSTSLEEVDEDLFASNAELTDCSAMFATTRLVTVPEKLFYNNPKINTFNALFNNTKTFTTVPAKLFEKNPEVTTFRMTFAATSLTGPVPQGLFANNPKCNNFQQTFSSTLITSVPEDIFAGCDKVTTFRTCFSGCTELESIPGNLFTNSGAFATVTTTAFEMIFQNCKKLTDIPAGLFDGFTKVTSFSNAFNGCERIATVPAGLFATNSAVKTFVSVFQNCKSLTAVPDRMLSGLSLVTSFSNLFSGCTELVSVGSQIFDGCAALTNISSMFKGCVKLTTIAEDAFTGAPKITSIASIFDGCTALTTVPAGVFAPLASVTTASGVFANSGIRQVPATLFEKNTAITSFSKIFNLCPDLTTVPDDLFKANTRVTDFTYAFAACPELTTVGKVFGTSTASVKLTQLFAESPKLTTVPAGLFDGLSGATMFDKAFFNCIGLETLPAGLFARNLKVTTYANCFENCTSLQGVPSRMFCAEGSANTASKTFTAIFAGCTSIRSIAADAFAGLQAASTTLANAFKGCTALESVPSGLFRENPTISNYGSVFNGCTGLKSVGTEVFNCEKSTSLSSIFSGCTSLETVGEKPFINAAKVTNVASLFNGCSSLRAVPAGIFDEMVVLVGVGSTFNGCTSLAGESPYTTGKDNKQYHLYERTAENAEASGLKAITSSKSCFAGCAGLSDYAQIPAVWK